MSDISAASSNWFTSMFSSDTSPGDVVASSTMNVTKIVSIVVALFGGLTQALNLLPNVTLSSTQMVVIWLVVAALIAALGITDMVCRTYGAAHSASVTEHVFSAPLPVDVFLNGDVKAAQWIGWTDEPADALAHVRFIQDNEDSWVRLDDVRSHQ